MTEADIDQYTDVSEAVKKMASDICCALVGVLIVEKVFGPKEKTPWRAPSSDFRAPSSDKGRRIAVNMCSGMMRRSELKEAKRQAKLIKKRYG